MKLISFAFTADLVANGSKTVTRRCGWVNLRPGTLLLACVKTHGVKERDRREVAIIRVLEVSREPLRRLIDDPAYGEEELRLEGFSDQLALAEPSEWVEWFCKTHKPCTPETIVTRIRFKVIF